MPPGAVVVTRPTRWGNPHRASKPGGKRYPCPLCNGAIHTQHEAVLLYRVYLDEHPDLVARARRELAGWDLACWCRPHEPCHADILLSIVNG